jgi:hypothetical protein
MDATFEKEGQMYHDMRENLCIFIFMRLHLHSQTRFSTHNHSEYI